MRQDPIDALPLAPPTPKPASSALRVPFGLKDGRMWRPKEVRPGLDCGCVCSACSGVLVAKATDSRHRRAHFAHLAESNCKAGYETALHRKAKELLADHRAVLLPSWDGEAGMPNPPLLADDAGAWWAGAPVVFESREVQLRDVRLEVHQGDYTPDAVALDDEGELLIEIKVSHAVDEAKRGLVQAQGRRMFEIDLAGLGPDIVHDEDALRDAVLYGPTNRHWVHSPEATEAWRASLRNLEAWVEERNRELARERQSMEEARQEVERPRAVARAEYQAQQESRARFREQQRAPYAELLDELPHLISHERIGALLAEYEIRDGHTAEEMVCKVPSLKIQNALRYSGSSAWIYLVHPSLWQAACYFEFVHDKPGAQFNQRDVARWVLSKFGREEGLYKLFRAQYAFRNKARGAGFAKNRISFWAFTELENRQIPNFYRPINEFIERLTYLQALERVPGIIGQVRVTVSG